MLMDVAVRRAKGTNRRCLSRVFCMVGTNPGGYQEGKGYYRDVFLDLRYKHIHQKDNPRSPLESILGFQGVGGRLINGTILNALQEMCQNDMNVAAGRWRVENAKNRHLNTDSAYLLGERNPLTASRHNRELFL